MALGSPTEFLFVVWKVSFDSWGKSLPVCELQNEIKDILTHRVNPAQHNSHKISHYTIA